MIAASAVDRLFTFGGLAVIGGTPRNYYAKSILRGIGSVGYAGNVACINPNAESVGEVTGYATLADVPFTVDAALIAVRADRVPEALEDCGRHGIRAVTIISAGFAESGEAGRTLQAQLAEVAERYGIAVCGPNCLGLASLDDRTSMYCSARLPERFGEVAILSHSGGMLNEVVSYGSYRGIRFSKVISSGNEAVLNVADYLDYLVDDSATTTIGLIVEGIRAPERMRTAFERAIRVHKPIVAIKLGTSKLAAASAITHTGAMAGSADLFAALCAQTGVTLVEDIDELCETLLLFSKVRSVILSGASEASCRGAAAIEISGGGKGLICDLAERHGVTLRQPRNTSITNPIDIGGSWETPQSLELHQSALETLNADGYDVIISRLSVLPSGPIEMTLQHAQLMYRMQQAHPQTLFAALGRASDVINPVWRAFCEETGMTYLQGYARGLSAVGHLERYRALCHPERSSRSDVILSGAGTSTSLSTSSARAVEGRRTGIFDEAETKTLLAGLGFPVNPTCFAASVDEAVGAAAEIGFPVVVKGLSPRAVHKSDGGFVVLDVRDEPTLRTVAGDMLGRLHALGRSGEERVGLSIQSQVLPGLEVIVGAYRDELYGPIVLCALGGTFAEAFDERLLWLAPVERAEALRRLERSKVATLAKGFRALPPADIDGLASLIGDLSVWIAADERIRELDLNPVILRGNDMTIVDARAVTA